MLCEIYFAVRMYEYNTACLTVETQTCHCSTRESLVLKLNKIN